MAAPHILVVDDEPAVLKVLVAILEQDGLTCAQAGGAAEALERLNEVPYELVITDLRMPGQDGVALMREIVAAWPDVPVILLTAHATLDVAVDALRAGAADFLSKPFDRDEVLFAVRKALAHGPHRSKSVRPETLLQEHEGPMNEALELIRRAAPTFSAILLRGETGTGKSLLAQEIHRQSRVSGGPFVTVFCGALPEQLVESELFGHEKGAFTGAAQRKPGRVEFANGGTLFFDEIGDLAPTTQLKLLRLLQERSFERLGGSETLHTDARFIAATHRNLEELVRAGKFREDLYYRLSVVPIRLPRLRERRGDLTQLALRFLENQARSANRPGLRMAADAMDALAAEEWPGNVRQLENFIERLVVLSTGPVLTLGDVQRELARQPDVSASGRHESNESGRLDAMRGETERQALQEALSRSSNNRTLAARLLGVSRRTLYNKLQEHGLS
jgi:two-component system response regulator AtoC